MVVGQQEQGLGIDLATGLGQPGEGPISYRSREPSSASNRCEKPRRAHWRLKWPGCSICPVVMRKPAIMLFPRHAGVEIEPAKVLTEQVGLIHR